MECVPKKYGPGVFQLQRMAVVMSFLSRTQLKQDSLEYDFMASYCFLTLRTVTPRLLIVYILVGKMF